MNWLDQLKTWLLLALLLGGSIACASPSVSGPTVASSKVVTVIKKPMAVHRKITNKPSTVGYPASFTVWQFHCVPALEYDVVGKKQTGKQQLVSLKITKADVQLSLVVTMNLTDFATKREIAHEEGHVKICSTAYARASLFAESAAQSIIGRVYQGQGDDMDMACKAAIQQAAAELTSQYRKGTVDYVNRVSQLYDKIDAKEKMPVDRAVNLAERQAFP